MNKTVAFFIIILALCEKSIYSFPHEQDPVSRSSQYHQRSYQKKRTQKRQLERKNKEIHQNFNDLPRAVQKAYMYELPKSSLVR